MLNYAAEQQILSCAANTNLKLSCRTQIKSCKLCCRTQIFNELCLRKKKYSAELAFLQPDACAQQKHKNTVVIAQTTIAMEQNDYFCHRPVLS